MSDTPAAPRCPAPHTVAAPRSSSSRRTRCRSSSCKDLYIRYTDRAGRTVQAVEDVSLTVANKPGVGELAVFLGPSGCGKSTILKAVAGLLTPDSGEVLVDGKQVEGTGRDRGHGVPELHQLRLAHGAAERGVRARAAGHPQRPSARSRRWRSSSRWA